jgi:DNA mismatch endonuclease, patch repair protein
VDARLGGVKLPYPVPSTPAASAVMRGNRRRDTRPEVALRSALHARGLRFRKDFPIQVGDLRVRVDVAFPARRLAVFVDGCFWHSCSIHGNQPRVNSAYWGPKLARNLERDRRVDQALQDIGWAVVRVWEHEDAGAAADRVAAMLPAGPASGRSSS